MAEKDYDNQTMRDLRAQVDKLKNTELLPLPTPEIGRAVIWHKGGDQDSVVAAIVVARVAPGQITLMVCEPNTQPRTVAGVFFEKFPLHEDQKVAILKRTGTWGYCDGDKPTQGHLELHRKQIQTRIDGLNNSLRLELEKAIRMEQALKSPPEPVKGKAKGDVANASA